MKLKIITIALLCAVLLTSCGAEVEEPAHGTPIYDITPFDEIEPEIVDEPEETPEPDVGDDDPVVPYDEPEPYTGNIIRVSFENDFSLIADEETELTTELRILVNRFNFPLLPADIIETSYLSMTRIYQDYVGAGLIEPYERTEEELKNYSFIERDGLYFESVMKIENLNFIFNDIFSENAEYNVTNCQDFVTSDGLFGYGAFGITSGYHYILMRQEISDNLVELYFYCIYNDGFKLWRKGYEWHENIDDGVIWLDQTVVGEWEHVDYISTGYIILYEDLFDTLDIVKYTFILEDGRYKILNIENVT